MESNKLAYLAGIVDGEGSIGLVSREKSRKQSYIPRLSVYNCDFGLMEFLKSEFGGTILTRKARSDKHSDGYIIVWSHDKARKLIDGIEPYLVIKKKQANLISEYGKLVYNPGRNGLSRENIEKKETIKKSINLLNQKGPQ